MVMWMAVLALGAAVGAAEWPEAAMPMRAEAPDRIVAGPGATEIDGVRIALDAPVVLRATPPTPVDVVDEPQGALPVWRPEGNAFWKGRPLRALATEECSATGLLMPETLRIKTAPGEDAACARGVDYDLEAFWAVVGRLEGGAIAADAEVYADYTFRPMRIDTIAADADGAVQIIPGEAGVCIVYPPELAEGLTALANVFWDGTDAPFGEENLYPIDPAVDAAAARGEGPSVAERLLPRTLAKLRAGKPVTIVAWGDSVTNGGGVNADVDAWYQQQFLRLLEARFPETPITLHTAAWGGASSRSYLDSPKGSEHDFERDVLERTPDLVTIEFVNDAYLDEAGVRREYGAILDMIQGIGAEAVLITPHLVRPDWMQAESAKFDDDPRPYVQALRAFAAERGVAVAEASELWCKLWRRGIPYITLLANSINHPDERGHRMFAEALMALFPEE